MADAANGGGGEQLLTLNEIRETLRKIESRLDTITIDLEEIPRRKEMRIYTVGFAFVLGVIVAKLYLI